MKLLIALLAAAVAKPVQLIRPAVNHVELECVAEGLEALRRLPAPVAVVSAVGAVHSGKSFLLNRLVDFPGPQGFAVGYTIRPETKGLWMWGDPLERRGTSVVFLDTEGFFSPNVSDTYDAKMFAIATLMSSEVIYNTVKFIDNHHVELLELLIRRTNLFGLRAYARHSFNHSDETSPSQPVSNLAAFLRVLVPNQLSWVVQDFVQDLGRMQPEDWLSELIELDRKQTEGSVGNFFKHIDCVPLPVPAGDSETLQKLDLVNPKDLDSSYIKAVNKFRTRLLDRAEKRPKLKGGSHVPADGREPYTTPMSGSDIANLVEFLVAAANNGPIENGDQPFPQLPSIAEQFTALQVRLMRGDILAILERDLMTAVEKAFRSGRPLARFHFEKEVDKAETQAHLLWSSTIRGLISNSEVVSEMASAEGDFMGGLESVREKVIARNCELVDIWCKNTVNDLLEEYNDKIRSLTMSPQLPALLETELANFQVQLKKTYLASMAKEDGGWSLKPNSATCCRGSTLEEFNRNIDALTSKAKKYNDKLIEDHFDALLKDLGVQWQQEVDAAKSADNLLSQDEKKLQELFKRLRKQTTQSFVQGMTWYRGLSVYQEKKKELETLADRWETTVWKEWSAKCQQAADDFLRTISIRYPYQLRRSISLPADTLLLEQFMTAEAAKLAIQFKDVVFCADSSAGRTYHRRFDQLVTDTAASLRGQNIKTVKEITGQPLKDLKESLLESAVKFWIPQSFEMVAKRKALDTLQKAMTHYEAERGTDSMPQMSKVLLDSVAQDFVDSDLKATAKKLIVCRLISHSVCVIVLAIFLVNCFTSFRDHAWGDCVKWSSLFCLFVGFYALQAFRTALRQMVFRGLEVFNETAMAVLTLAIAVAIARFIYRKRNPQVVVPVVYDCQGIPVVTHATTPIYNHAIPQATTNTPDRWTSSTFPSTNTRPRIVNDTFRSKNRPSFGPIGPMSGHGH